MFFGSSLLKKLPYLYSKTEVLCKLIYAIHGLKFNLHGDRNFRQIEFQRESLGEKTFGNKFLKNRTIIFGHIKLYYIPRLNLK